MSDRFSEIALDAQVDLIAWLRTKYGRAYCPGLIEAKGSIGTTAPGLVAEELAASYARAATFAVTRDVCTLLAAAAATMAPQAFHRDDFPAPAGFVYLQDPFWLIDVHGDRYPVKSLAWEMSVRMDPDGVALHEAGAFMMSITTDTAADINLRSHGHGEMHAMFPSLSLFDISGVPFEEALTSHHFKDHAATPIPVESNLEMFRLFAAFLAFVQQRVVTSAEIVPSRQARKRAVRVAKTSAVRVVQLRRRDHGAAAAAAASDGSGRTHDHRWAVSGHWRQQWYPSIEDHRQIWIDPYVKGPEAAPLRIQPTVFKVAR